MAHPLSFLARINTTTLSADDKFGPFFDVPGKKTFDFTLLFEETILSILPSALLLLLIPPRILRLWRTPRKVTGSYLQTTKIVLLVIFATFQIINVVEVSQSSLRTRASLAAALLALASALGLCLLSYAEHTRNIRPSSIINAYLLLTLPFDAAQLRTRWLRGESPTENGVASAMLAVKLLILVSEATEKRKFLLTPYAHPSPEATSGLYSRGLFWWLNPLFRLGFRNAVSEDDLFAADEDLLSSPIAFRFAKHWQNRQKYPQKHNLAWVLFRTMLRPFFAGVLPRLVLIFFRFMQPLLISNITQLMSDPDSESAGDRGWGLTAAFGLVYIGLAVTGGAYYHKSNRFLTMVRGALVSAIYTQTLDLSITSLDETAAVTLMSSDVERIFTAVEHIHYVWSGPIEIALAIWLLQKEIGLALLGPLVTVMIALSGPSFISKYMGPAQKAWVDKIQTRIDATAKMLSAMKGIKMLGLGSKISQTILQLRIDEVTESLRMRKLFIGLIAAGNMSDIFVPGAAFAVYVIVANVNGQQLDVTSAFTALSLITLLVGPIRFLVFTTPPLIAALSCFDRIEAFLNLPTKTDHRILLANLEGNSRRMTREYVTTNVTPLNPDIELEDIVLPRVADIAAATIQVRDLTLAWSEEGLPVINDVSIDFQPGNLTMIVGPVGCGKSSLLKGLLGETPSSKGNVFVDRANAAFVDQTPWIQNSSIRQNIIGVSDFQPVWFAQVVNACALDTDLEAFPDGDGTKVGSAGTALSGGQKLRLGLARAVYSRLPTLFLDDVFSGLDATSEENIFSRLLGKNGLLRRLGTTVVLVTHGAHRLSYADHIVALDVHGRIAEQGKFDHLISSNGYIAGLAARHISEEVNDAKDESLPVKAVEDSEIARQNAAADLNRGAGNWAIYMYYFGSTGWRNIMFYPGLMITYSALLRFPDLWIKFWTSAIAAHGNSVNGLYLGILIAIEFISVVVLLVLSALQFLRMVPHSALSLHKDLLDTVEKAPLFFFTSTDSGQVVNRFSQDLGVIDSELPLAMIILSNNFCLTIIQAIFISISAAYFAILLPFVAIASYIIQKFYLRTSRQIRLMDLEAKAPLYTNFLETLTGLVTIRAFGWSDDMQKRNMTLLDASQRPFYLLYCIQRWLALVVDLLVAALGIILVALIVKYRQSTDAGFVGVALISMMSFNITLSEVIKNWTAIETSLGAVSRIKSFVIDTPSENLPQESQPVPDDWPCKGSIKLSKVSASYDPSSLPSTLQNINLSIVSGQKLGVCGHSGSGKSSIIALLLHMLERTSGQITIDGIDLCTIPRQTLRERLTVIPQDPVFIPGSIRTNLDLPSDPSSTSDDAAAEQALRAVNLWSIVSAAGGLDARMDADSQLSAGQRQLFCLARAMLKSNSHQIGPQSGGILLLDEATASVDLATDRLMQRVIAERFANYTVVAVAHRLQTIRHYDRVAVMAEGKLVEYGEPAELLRREGGKFRTLWEGSGGIGEEVEGK